MDYLYLIVDGVWLAAPAITGNTASAVSSGGPWGSVKSPTSTAMAAATSSSIGLPTVPKPGIMESIVILVVGWLIGGH
jgi:hypothetical protein